MMMMSPAEHADFIKSTFGGSGKFKKADDIKPKSAAETFNSIASSGYGYAALKSMFKQDKDGNVLKDKSGNVMWKDSGDTMTNFRRSQMQFLQQATGRSNGSGSKAMEAVRRLSELEAQGWSTEELNRVVSQTYGKPNTDFSLNDLNLGATSGYQRASALKKYIRGHAGNFAVDQSELQDMVSALDNLVYSNNMSAELSNIESWITDSIKTDVKKAAVNKRLANYDYGTRDLESVISSVDKLRGGDIHAAKFYKSLSADKQREIAGNKQPVRQRNGNFKFAPGSIGDSIQRVAGAAKDNHFGFTSRYNKSGALEFGFYDPNEAGIFDQNGNIVQSKVKTVTMPTQDEMGDILFDSTKMANFRNRHYDVATDSVYTTNAQEEAVKAVADQITRMSEFTNAEGQTVKYNPFASRFLSNPDKIVGSIGNTIRESLHTGSNIGSASTAQEAQDLVKTGATVEQHLFRSGIIHNNAFLGELIQSTEVGRQAFADQTEQYNAMLSTLNNYMGLAVNDATIAEKYLESQDTSWMGNSKGRITSAIRSAIKAGGDLNQNLKEEHGAQLMYTSQGGYPTMIPGGKNYFGRTPEQAWSGTAQASEAADAQISELLKDGIAFKDSMVTKDWFNAAKQYGVNIGHNDINGGTTGARYALYKYGKTTDADLMQTYKDIAADTNVDQAVRELAQQKINSGMVKSVANDSMAFLGDNRMRVAMQTRREKNRNISEQDAIKLFGDNGFFGLKNLEEYNIANNTNFSSFDELIQNMAEGSSIKFGENGQGITIGTHQVPQFKDGKPIYRQGDIIDSLTMQNGVLKVAGHTYDPLGTKRFFMGDTKGTTTGISHTLSDSEIALNRELSQRLFGDQGVMFATEASDKLDARKVMSDLMGKLRYIKNTLVDPSGKSNILQAFNDINIGNGRKMSDLMDSNGFWKNDFSDGNSENLASMMRTLVNGTILDDFGKTYFGDKYNPNIRAGTIRATDDTPYFDSGSKYKWNVKSQQSLENSLKDLNDLGVSQKQTDAFMSNFNKNEPSAYGEAVRGALRQTAGRLMSGEGNYIDILSPDAYITKQNSGVDMSNYINARDIGSLVYDEGGYVTKESLDASWGKIMERIRTRSQDTGKAYQARVQLDSPIEELVTDYNGKKVPLAASSIVLPNIDGMTGDAAILGTKVINAVGEGNANIGGQINAARRYLRDTHNDVNNKEGSTWQAENARKINTSLWGRAVGPNTVSDIKTLQNRGSYAVMNQQQMTETLLGYDGEKQQYSFMNTDEYIQHYTNLARELYYAENEIAKNNKGVLPDGASKMFASQKELDAYTKKLSNTKKLPKKFGLGKHREMAERLSGYASIDRQGGPLYGIDGFLSRLPILSRRGEHGVKLYSSKSVDQGNIQVNQALHSLMNGDFDGDAVRALLTSFQSGAKSYKEFAQDKEVAQKLYDFDSQMAREIVGMNALSKGYNILNKDGSINQKALDTYLSSQPNTTKTSTSGAKISEEQIAALSNPQIKGLATWASLADKEFVAQFSNKSYGMRNAMGKAGVHDAVADLALSAMQLPEQQAISAKHKIENLVSGNSNVSAEELISLKDNVEKVFAAQNEAANMFGTTGFEHYYKALETAGFTKNGVISGNPAISALAPVLTKARLASLKSGTSMKDQLVGLLSNQLGLTGDASELGGYAEQMMRGEIAGPVWQKAMAEANKVTSSQNYGANLFDLARRQSNKISSSSSYEGGELWALKRHMDRVEKFGAATTLLEEGQSRYAAERDQFAAGRSTTAGSFANAVEQDVIALNQLTTAIGANATAVSAATTAYSAATGQVNPTQTAATTETKTHTAQFATLSSDHKYMVNGKNAEVDATNTGIIGALTGKTQMDQSAINGLTSRIDNGTYAKAGNGLLDVNAYGEDLVNFWKSGDFGTAVHRELENIANIKGLMKSSGISNDVLSTLNTMFDIGNYLQSSGYSMGTDNKLVAGKTIKGGKQIADMYNAYWDTESAWLSKRETLFGTDDATDAATSKLRSVSDMSRLMAITPGETIATELSMVGGFGKQGQYKIGSTLDYLNFDEHTGIATIGDHKTTQGLYGASLAQQLSLERYNLEDILGSMKGYINDNKLSADTLTKKQLNAFAKNFGLSDNGVARNLFKMANYSDKIIWKGKATHAVDGYAEGADVNLLSRDEVNANVDRAMANNPWTAIELSAANRAAIAGKKTISHGAQIQRTGVYSGLYGDVGSDINNAIAGLSGNIAESDAHGALDAKSWFSRLSGAVDDYYALLNKKESGVKLTDKELSTLSGHRTTISSAQQILSAADAGAQTGLDENQLGILRQILQAYTQINSEAIKTKAYAQEYQNTSNQVLATERQIAALKTQIATQGGKATTQQEEALKRLESDRETLMGRKAAYRNDPNAGKYAPYYDSIDKTESDTSKEIKEGTDASAFAAGVAAAYKTESEKEAEAKQNKIAANKAMTAGLGGERAYNNAELNMIRANKALEAARRTGNAQQIAAAEQQVEGARAQGAIATQYKPQFTLYDKAGNIVETTGADGKPVSMDTLNGKVERGVLKTWDQETQQWKETNLHRTEALKHQQSLNMLQAQHTQAVGKTSGQVKTLSSLIGSVVGGMKQTVSYLMRTSLVYGAIGKVKQIFASFTQTIASLNKAYVDLRIASGQTDSQMKDSLKIYNQMAKEMGKTTQEVANAANDWLRAGYNAEESAKLIKNSMQLSTVGMIDSAKATEYLISTMKGWKLGVNDMEGVVDKLSELDRHAAITSGDLAESMSRANVSAQLAGSELNKYMAYLTTVSDVSQLAPESVGTAFKTLYSRYGNVKAGKFVAGAGEEGNAEEFEALNDIEKVLNKIGISMRDTSAEFRSFDDVLAEIAEKWATLTDVEKNAISTAFAGVRQREVFNVLLENFDQVSKFENVAENSEGTTQEKMAIYGDSVEASKARRTAAVEEFTQDFNVLGADGDDILKGWNDLLTYIIKNWKQIIAFITTVTILSKGLLSGSMFGGLVKLFQSLTVSAANFSSKVQIMGSNLPLIGNAVSKLQEKQLGSSTREVTGWRAAAMNQISSQQNANIYGSAMKYAQNNGIDAIQADRGASFLSGMTKEQAKVWNSMSTEQQRQFIQANGMDDPSVASENKLVTALGSNTEALTNNTLALKGDVDNTNSATTTHNVKPQTGTSPQTGVAFPGQNDQFVQTTMFDDAENALVGGATKAAVIEEQSAVKKTGIEEQSTIKQTVTEEQSAHNEAAIEKLSAEQEAAIEQSGLKGYVGSNLYKTDKTMVGAMSQDKGVKRGMAGKTGSSGLGAASGALSMGAMMASSMIMSNVASGTGMSETGQSATTMIATMAPMIGMMFGPVGALVGTAVSAITVGITALVDANVETAEEIKEAAEEAKEILAVNLEKINKATEQNNSLKDNKERFAELLKGVDLTTGLNISLSTSEWEEYQSILEQIIEASEDLYASYDAQGNIIAKSHTGFVNLNTALEDTIKLNNETIAKNAQIFAQSTGQRVDVLKGILQTTKEESELADNKSNTWGTNWGTFYLSSEKAARKISKDGRSADVKVRGDLENNFWDGAASAFFSGFRSLTQVLGISTWFTSGNKSIIGTNNTISGGRTRDNIENFVRAAKSIGYTQQEMVDELKSWDIVHGYGDTAATEEELNTIVTRIVNNIENENYVYSQTTGAYSKQLSQDMVTALQSSTFYLNLDAEAQSFLQNLIQNFTFDPYQKSFGEYVLDDNYQRVLKTESQLTADAQMATWGASNLTNWAQSNPNQFATVQNFDVLNANAEEWQTYRDAADSMMDGVSGQDTNGNGIIDPEEKNYELEVQTARSLGFVVKEENIRRNSKGEIIGYTYENNRLTDSIWAVALDKRQQLWDQGAFEDIEHNLIAKGIAPSHTSYRDLSLINEFKNDRNFRRMLSDTQSNQQQLFNYLKEMKMGTSSTISEYYSLLTSEMTARGLSIASPYNISNNLNNQDIQSTYAFKQLDNMAKQLNVDIEYLIDNMELFGSIDPFFRTTKSLTEMETIFDNLYSVIDDIREDGTITAENLQIALENYPDELLPLINDAEAFADKVEELYSSKQILMAAPIKTALDQNTSLYIDGIDDISDLLDGEGTIGLDEGSKQILQSFGNAENLSKIVSHYEKFGADNPWNYFNYGNTNDAHTFEKDLMDIFGIDRTKNFEDAQQNLKDTLIKQYTSTGLVTDEMSYTDLLNEWKYILQNGNAQIVQNYLDAQNYLTSLESSYELLEDQTYQKAIDKSLTNLEMNYDAGKTSLDDYINGLKMLAKTAKDGSEQQKELNKKIAEAEFDKYSSQFKEGIITLKQYNDELERMVSLLVVGSEQWNERVQAMKDAYDTENEKLGYEIQMLEDDDYAGMLKLWQQKIDNGYKKMATIEAEGIVKAQQNGTTYNKYDDAEWLEAREEVRQDAASRADVYDDMYESYVDDYNIGNIGLSELIDHISALRKESGLTEKQVEKLREAEEDYRLELSKRKYEDGQQTGDEYRAELLLNVQSNAKGSEEERQSLDEMIASYDSDLNKLNTKINLLDEHDYDARAALFNESLDSIKSKLILLEAMGLKGSEQWLETLQQGAEIQQKILDDQKASLEYQIEQSQEVMDAYSSLINFGIEELQNRQQDINDLYDDEISKLQDINDQKKRSIELTKLQQELENAQKEKTRVYTAGIGWTYQENKAKVKEAKQNLADYLDERKISDLQYAQKQQNALIEDQIEKLQDIQEYIDNINKKVNATEALQDLIYKGIIPEGATLQNAIQTINNGVINGPDGKIQQLDTHFETYAKIFTDKSSDLNTLLDSYDQSLNDIKSYWSTSYESPADLVNALEAQIADKILGDENTSGLVSIESTISAFLGDHTYADWVAEITNSISGAADSIGASQPEVDTSALEAALAKAQKAVEEAKAALVNLKGSLDHSELGWFKGTGNNLSTTYDIPYWGIGYLSEMGAFKISSDGHAFMKIGEYWYQARAGESGGYVVSIGSEGMSNTDFLNAYDDIYGYSSGIENGPVTYTGLAMLHGSPSNPEYVLNSDQVSTLLKNLATVTMSPYQAPKVDSYNHTASSTVYQFNGDLNLPNVQRPDQFFSELLKQANVQFPTIKENYR